MCVWVWFVVICYDSFVIITTVFYKIESFFIPKEEEEEEVEEGISQFYVIATRAERLQQIMYLPSIKECGSIIYKWESSYIYIFWNLQL